MTAILLAAGVGKRMGSGAGPKCLLQVGGRSLLRRTLDSLRAVGVKEVALVTGFQSADVEKEARAVSGEIRLSVLQNPRYREGAILSLWTAREFLNRDLLVMDADVLCPPAVFERLVGSKHSNCLVVDGSVEETGEEQMVFGREGRALHIAKKATDSIRREMDLFGESLGFLRLSGEAASCLRELLDGKVRSGWVAIEHEQAYPDLFRKVFVGFERVDGLAWTEIDTPEDLARAEQQVFPRWTAPQCVNRVISAWFLPWILRVPLSPNQWTFIGLLLGLSSLFYIAQGDRRAELLGALLFQLYYLTDNWDGEVARRKGLCSRWGGWFDVAVDGVVQTALPLAVVAGIPEGGWTAGAWLAGWAACAGIALDFAVTLWAKARGFGPAVPGETSRRKWFARDTAGSRWIRVNWTNENFSWVVVLILLLQWRFSFLAATAVGCQIFWIQFVWRERRRLMPALGSPRHLSVRE